MNQALFFILPGLAAAGMAFALTPLTARLARCVGAIDQPGWRKMHVHPIPRLGGLAVVSASAVVWAAAVWLSDVSPPPDLLAGLVLGVLPILAVSALDDMRGVPAGRKVLVHVIGASLAVSFGVSLGEVVHLFDVAIPLGALAAPLSIAWLVGVTSAFNLIDGLDGLSAGLALIASLCMAAVFGLVGQPVMAGAALVLAGALAGFLPFNLHPARLFLGDSGAAVIGFCLGAFALKGGSTLSSGFAALVPVFIMGLPVADTLITIARRIISRIEHRGAGVLVADRNHIHHRLLALGVDHRTAVLILYGVGAVCAIGAFASLLVQARHAALFIVAVLVAGTIGVRRLGYNEFAFIRRGAMLRVYESPVLKTSMFVVFFDLGMSALAAYVAIGLKLDVWNPADTVDALVDLFAVLAPLTVGVFWYSNLYRGSWRVASVSDLARACGAAAGVTVLGAIVHPLLARAPQPASVFIIYGLVSIVTVTWSRGSYVVLRASQRRASHTGVPVLVYGAGKHGAAAAEELFENSRLGLKPIGFVDDDPGWRGRRIAGLPVLGPSYELEPLIAAHGVKAVVVARPIESRECESMIVDACTRAAIGLLRMKLQFHQQLDVSRNVDTPKVAQLPGALPARASGAEARSLSPVESEPCVSCGGRSLRRSRIRGFYERLRRLRTSARPFRCDDCGWRGWLLPLERATPIKGTSESNLASLDAVLPPLAALGKDSQAGIHRS